jgi:hypothetical protein
VLCCAVLNSAVLCSSLLYCIVRVSLVRAVCPIPLFSPPQLSLLSSHPTLQAPDRVPYHSFSYYLILYRLVVSQFARKESETLNMSEFIDVLFKQLYEAQPKISLEIEAGEKSLCRRYKRIG